MRLQSHCKIAKGPMDATPLVDVTFLLLIFLVLSSPMVLQPGIGMVELQPSNTPSTASFQAMVVTVTRDNLIFFNNQLTTLDKLRDSLRALAGRFPRQELVIKADRQGPNGTVVQIMTLDLEAGITAINWATRPEIASPAAKK
ncbi:MAG: biopolymer transporter ExbD [Verrucomicrobiae bacterium]|nr:biopolymer transporter ExbD [Verrucomicrobiae bacterium]